MKSPVSNDAATRPRQPSPSQLGLGMSQVLPPKGSRQSASLGPLPGASRPRRVLILAGICLSVLVGMSLLGMWTGSYGMKPMVVIDALANYDPENFEHLIIRQSRIPRLLLDTIVGIGLGVAGALMQALTRNPLADPGILGINAGAGAAIAIAIAYFGYVHIHHYIWFGFLGAGLTAVVVYTLGALGRGAASPGRLALAGAALAMAISALTSAILLNHISVFAHFRFWAVGSTQGRGYDIIALVAPFIAVGCALALVLMRPLNAIALGEDSARGLGAHVPLIRLGTALAVLLTAGAATAAAGPIAFIGLAAPHAVRRFVGPDHRLVIPLTMMMAPAMLVATDVLGKMVVAPAELQTGVATALLGGPVFVALVRSRRVVGL